MKVLVKNYLTGNYLFSETSWTEKEKEALDFEAPERALQFCRLHHLVDVEIILKGGAVEQKVSLEEGPKGRKDRAPKSRR